MKRIRLTEQDVERIVKRILKEDDFDWTKDALGRETNQPLYVDETRGDVIKIEVRPGNIEDMETYGSNTKWSIGPSYSQWERTALMYASNENPILVYFNKHNQDQKVGCVMVRGEYECYNRNDLPIPNKEKFLDELGVEDNHDLYTFTI
jgi:hypothetical protein